MLQMQTPMGYLLSELILIFWEMTKYADQILWFLVSILACPNIVPKVNKKSLMDLMEDETKVWR